jgi:hypothetical protein
MVGTYIPMTTHTKLTSNVNISLMINSPRFIGLLDRGLITLPRSTTIDTLHLTRLASSPLFETGSVDILATGTFAPENICWLVRLIEFHDADGAVSFNWLAGAACVCLLGCCRVVRREGCDWCVCKDLGELGGEEGELVGKIFTDFEDVDEDLFTVNLLHHSNDEVRHT